MVGTKRAGWSMAPRAAPMSPNRQFLSFLLTCVPPVDSPLTRYLSSNNGVIETCWWLDYWIFLRFLLGLAQIVRPDAIRNHPLSSPMFRTLRPASNARRALCGTRRFQNIPKYMTAQRFPSSRTLFPIRKDVKRKRLRTMRVPAGYFVTATPLSSSC